jgi:hypothetical protein
MSVSFTPFILQGGSESAGCGATYFRVSGIDHKEAASR